MKVGIASPSDPIGSFPVRVKRATSFLESLGLSVIFSPHARNTDETELLLSPEKKALDIHYLIDNDVDLILMSTGGYNSNSVIPFLDHEKIKNSKTMFAGFSDSTALLLAIHLIKKSDCFYGPSLMGCFGDFDGPSAYSLKSFLDTCINKKESILYHCPKELTTESLFWDKEDIRARKYKMVDRPWTFDFNDKVSGNLIGGNLSTFLKLLGTPSDPIRLINKDTVLFFEELNSTVNSIIGQIEQLAQSGVFRTSSALVLGRFTQLKDSEQTLLHRFIAEKIKSANSKLVCNVDISHSDPRIVFPIGANVELDGQEKSIRILRE